MSNPFLDRQAKRGIGGTGRSSEGRVAKALGARLTPASGAMRGAKGDAATKEYLLEMKSTTAQSIALQVGWLSKISQEAIAQSKTPALVISFVLPDGKPQMKTNAEWVCVPRHVFEEWQQ